MNESLNHERGIEERMQDMKDYVAHDPDFVCGWGKKSMLAENTTVEGLSSTDNFQQTTDRIVCALQDGLVTHEKDACILVHNDDCSMHITEYLRAMMMYAATRTAAGMLEGKPREGVEQESIELARSFFLEPDNLQEKYPKFGRIGLHEDQLMVLGMSPLYREKHGRKSPVASWIITRMSDGGAARRANPTAAQQALLRAWEGVKIPYAAIFPYILPEDIRFAMPSFLGTLKDFERLKPEMVPGSTPIDFAALMARIIARCGIMQGNEFVPDMRKLTKENLEKWLREAGLLQ